MSRAIILVADGLGVGSAPDAKDFNDVGANTLGHIIQHMAEQNSPLNIPTLVKLGLVKACEQASNTELVQLTAQQQHDEFDGSFGYMAELSSGKDTPSGHWEMAGVPVLFDWGYFTEKTNSFPQELIDKLVEKTGVPGILANRHAPGTDVLTWHGEEHIATGKPICYTSVDSVFQIAAHEEHFGLDKLYEFCEAARELLDDYNIGRVIARPFVGESVAEFQRTGNRRDYSVLPPAPTMLDKMAEAGGEVISIGKISDIYAHQGITQKFKATGIPALMEATSTQLKEAPDNSIIFTNLVNFDQDFGHRRNIEGYADALEDFDQRLSKMLTELKDDDVLYIIADHGCDPSWVGTDHTREYVPIIQYGKNLEAKALGERKTFADLSQTICSQFSLEKMAYGESFWQQ